MSNLGNSYRDRRSLFQQFLIFFFNNIIVLILKDQKSARFFKILNSFQVTAFTTQSAEYDKKVTNISLFVYIWSPGLCRNSHQAQDLVASRQDLEATRHVPSRLYI